MDNIYNHWDLSRLPIHVRNNQKVSTTVQWAGTDSEANYYARGNKEYSSDSISYVRNTNGFRTYEFEQYKGNEVNVALGCSFTEGIGLPVNETWPFLIEQLTSLPTLNLGVGGGSTDTVSRVLSGLPEYFNINTAFILWPFCGRFECYDQYKSHNIMPNYCNLEETWILEDKHAIPRYYKNKFIVKLLSNLYGFKVVHLQASDVFDIDNPINVASDLARDNMHPGRETQANIAKWFLENATVR